MNIDGSLVGDTNVTDLKLEPGQDLVLRDDNGIEKLRLDASDGIIRLRDSNNSHNQILIDPRYGNILLGGFGQDGDLMLFPSGANSHKSDLASIRFNADTAGVAIGNSLMSGLVHVKGDNERIELDGDTGNISLSGKLELRSDNEVSLRLANDGAIVAGGAEHAGSLKVRNANGATSIRLDVSGAASRGMWGGNGTHGRLELSDEDGVTTIVLNGETGNLGLGATGGGNSGAIFIKDNNGINSVVLKEGSVSLLDDNEKESIVLNGKSGNVGLGNLGNDGNLFVKNQLGMNSIHLSGETGNINLKGDIRFSQSVADCAEEFSLMENDAGEPGTVMVLSDDGRLQKCTRAYDSHAAGVVSGAGSFKPGIILDKQEDSKGRAAIAMMGKVFCMVDASFAAIKTGDMLTTSQTPGHAMKVTDTSQAFGAVIGKALAPCTEGQKSIPILVNLQ